MTRKVFRSGNSLAVTLPPEARDIGIDEGREVEVEIARGAVVIRPAVAVDPQVLAWADEFISRHRELLRRLA